ncbi:Major_facilitator superfamily protein [Hexamita inflata]|uniref:Major facilitator superfamily protein n=1 Tax=Hexamita inflata TaxID=28002 RepID=A0AA86U4D1_9EUKA|nr:Major facilitator superfamily protein [Hexamita inflata]
MIILSISSSQIDVTNYLANDKQKILQYTIITICKTFHAWLEPKISYIREDTMHNNKLIFSILDLKNHSVTYYKNPVVSYLVANICSFYIGTGFGYLLPQTFMFYGHPASQTGVITMAAAIGMLTISLFLPKLSKRFLNKHIMVASFSVNVFTLVCAIIFSSNVYAFIGIMLIYQIVYTFFSQLIFPITLLSVPPQFTSQMSAVPTTARTLAQGVTMCTVSMIMQVSYDSMKTGEGDKRAWANAMRINMIVFLFFQIIGLILLVFRTGYAKNENGKRGFRADKVRQLKIMNGVEENSVLLRENVEGK